MSAEDGCPPEMALERHLAGEIKGTASDVWSSHIDGCAKCQAKLEEMKKTGAEYAASESAQKVSALVEKEPARWTRRALFVALPIAAAILVVVLLPRPPPDHLTPKGSGVFSLSSASPIARGAHVEMKWASSTPGFVAVIGTEKDGKTSVLFPESGDQAAAIEAGTHALGNSIVADDALDQAELVLYFAPHAFSIEEVKEGSFDGQTERIHVTVAP